MREIKFRVWDIVSKKFLERVPILNLTIGHFSVNGYFFQQYTGLLDKNGKEIYEGDIVDFENGYVSEIHWDRGGFRLNDLQVRSDLSHGIVIGNIYENPELLTK